MKKRFLYTTIATILISGVLFSGLEAREKSRLCKTNCMQSNFLNSDMLQKRQSDTWDVNNINILIAPEYYVEPPGFEFKIFSGMSVYDDWLSHKVTYEPYFLDVYLIDSHGSLTHMVNQEWDEVENKWTYWNQSIYTYETNNTLIKLLEQDWDGEHRAWLDSYKSDFSYSGPNGQIGEKAGYSWDDINSTWGEYSKSTYTYDSNNRLTETAEYDYEDLAWIGWLKANYSYDGSGNITQGILQEWDDEQDTWVNDLKITYVFNSNNLPTEMYEFIWDDSTQQWVNWTHSIITYSNTLYTDGIGQQWDEGTSSWIDVSKFEYFYTPGKDLDSYVTMRWDSTTKAWENWEKGGVSYNSKGNPSTITYFDWDTTTSGWIDNNDNLTIKYNYTSAIQQNQTLSSPASAIQITRKNRVLIAKLKGPSGAHDGMNVYDLQGRLINTARPVVKGNEVVYTWKAPAHKVYILSVKCGGEILTKRVLID